LLCINIEENSRVRISEDDNDAIDVDDDDSNNCSGIKPYLRMICSCEPENSPKARIMIFKITRVVVATGKLDMFMMRK
jgi:hypothetical protein